MTILFGNLIRVGLLCLAMMAVCFGSAQVPKPRVDAEAARIEKTGLELSKGKLSAGSRVFLEREMMSRRPGGSLAAEAKLLWACDMKQYPRARLLKLIERQTDAADQWWGVLYAGNFCRTLGLQLGGDPSLDQAGLTLTTRHVPENVLSEEDRKFFVRCLGAKTIGGRVDGLYAIFPKRRLAAADVGWIESRLAAQASKRHAPERDFWAYTERVVRYRSAPQKAKPRSKPSPVRIRLQ